MDKEKSNTAKESKDRLQTSDDGDTACSSSQNDSKRNTSEHTRVDLSRSDLIRLLSYLEGELQARDVVIATLRAEKAKQLLYQAKYGRLGLNDPLAALQRDSEATGATDDFDEAAVGHMYESQLAQLERLIAVQRRAHHRAKQVLASAERRHAKTVRELEQERQRSMADAAQGDDVCALLEKERERLKHEIEYQRNEHERLGKEIGKSQKGLQDEKERHKAMVLYLVNERRQLLFRLQEERLKVQQTTAQRDAQPVSSSGQSPTVNPANLEQAVNDLRRELASARRHRDDCRKALDAERQETASLREIVRTQEEDLHLIRQNILAKTRQLAKGPMSPTSPTKLLPKGRVPSATYPSPSAHQRPGAAPISASAQHSRFGHLPQLQAAPVSSHAPRAALGRPSADLTDGATPDAEQRNVRSQPPVYEERYESPRIGRRGPNDQLPAPSRPVTFGSRNNIAPPPPPQYASPTGYAQLPGETRQTSAGTTRSSTGQPPPSPSNKSRLPPQQTSDDRGRSQRQYPDGAAYGAEVEPEIAHLEAVINSFGRTSASLPPSASPNPSSPVWTPRNGFEQRQQHSMDGGSSGLKPKRSSSVPRNGGPPAMQQSDEQLSSSANGGARATVVRRSGTPNPPSRRPLLSPSGIKPLAPAARPSQGNTGTIRRNPFLKAIGVGLRKEKKATQV